MTNITTIADLRREIDRAEGHYKNVAFGPVRAVVNIPRRAAVKLVDDLVEHLGEDCTPRDAGLEHGRFATAFNELDCVALE